MSIVVENLTVSYQRRPVVHHVDMVFEDGKMWTIFGPNGAGKSTLLKAIMGLQKTDTGTYAMKIWRARTLPICRSSRTLTAASR